jgi:hypothetical protein
VVRFSVLVLIAIAAALPACGDSVPRLQHDETVPADLRALADDTWQDFLDAFPARWDCIPPPTLHAAWELGTRAEYRPATATLVVRVPGTPATLRSELLHEFAHHVEFVCADHELLRPGFLATQGFAPDTPWFGGATWESTPSEQYAEAVVELVEGRRTHLGGIILSDAAVAAVADWGSGAR